MNIPKHIGIILDGNRRWAKERGLNPWNGHDKGFEKLEEMIDWIIDLDLRELSLYCFSVQNFGRDALEKKYLFDIFRKAMKQLLDDKRIEEKRFKIRVVGRLWMFPQDIQDLAASVMEKTKMHDNHIVNFAMAYGGKEEIVDCVKKIAAEGKDITEESVQQGLWVPEQMDMVIRTSGELRTSNFFIWQAAYAELFFLEKYWPDFTKEDLMRCIDEFNSRQRRFGK